MRPAARVSRDRGPRSALSKGATARHLRNLVDAYIALLYEWDPPCSDAEYETYLDEWIQADVARRRKEAA